MFLSPEELKQLTGYEPNQRKRICDWLNENGIPYRTNRLGDPVVLKKSVEVEHYTAEPNLDFLKSA